MNGNAKTKTESRLRPYRKARATLGCVIVMTGAILLSGCDPWAGSETVRQIGSELNEVLPTVAEDDTEQSIRENVTFREVFFSIFPQFRP